MRTSASAELGYVSAVTIGSDDWRAIRMARSQPPGLAASDEARRRVLQASLSQAEELWEAAATAGARSRALPLFYSISQGSRAVCAAWFEGEQWQPRGHGLSGLDPEDGAEATWPVAEYRVKCQVSARGLFGMAAKATDSRTFTGDATVAQLWTGVPGLPTPTALVGNHPRCLEIAIASSAPHFTIGSQGSFEHMVRPTHAVLDVPSEKVAATLAPFPSAKEFTVVSQQIRTSLFGPSAVQSIVAFPGTDGSFRSLMDVAEGVGKFPYKRFVLRPGVGECEQPPPSPFMTLWALLFSLSQLTRYHPAQWVGALDDDQSGVAVTLDHGLEVALELVPRLLRGALGSPPRVLHALQAEIESLRKDGV